MPQLLRGRASATRAQLVLVELAGACVAGGLALGHAWTIPGAAAGGVLLLVAVVPVNRRWLYQLLISLGGLLRRRRQAARRPGLAGVVGQYGVESVPGGSGGNTIGVVRSGTTWSLPLLLGLEDVFNDDAPVPVGVLADLLRVEDVELSSVRLLTLTTPARVPSGAPSGPAAPLNQLAARYCLLTVDTRRAAQAIASRGGSTAAVQQILRRCAVHCEQVFANVGVTVRRLDEAAVAGLFPTWLGPASPATGRRAQRTVETWRDVRVAGTWSTVLAVTGEGDDVADRIARLTSAAPTPVVATSLLLRPGADPGQLRATMLVRLSAPENAPQRDAVSALGLLARAYDLVMQRLGGEQGLMLRATTPIGVGEPT